LADRRWAAHRTARRGGREQGGASRSRIGRPAARTAPGTAAGRGPAAVTVVRRSYASPSGVRGRGRRGGAAPRTAARPAAGWRAQQAGGTRCGSLCWHAIGPRGTRRVRTRGSHRRMIRMTALRVPATPPSSPSLSAFNRLSDCSTIGHRTNWLAMGVAGRGLPGEATGRCRQWEGRMNVVYHAGPRMAAGTSDGARAASSPGRQVCPPHVPDLPVDRDTSRPGHTRPAHGEEGRPS
jgi:hypothetical protein